MLVTQDKYNKLGKVSVDGELDSNARKVVGRLRMEVKVVTTVKVVHEELVASSSIVMVASYQAMNLSLTRLSPLYSIWTGVP